MTFEFQTEKKTCEKNLRKWRFGEVIFHHFGQKPDQIRKPFNSTALNKKNAKRY